MTTITRPFRQNVIARAFLSARTDSRKKLYTARGCNSPASVGLRQSVFRRCRRSGRQSPPAYAPKNLDYVSDTNGSQHPARSPGPRSYSSQRMSSCSHPSLPRFPHLRMPVAECTGVPKCARAGQKCPTASSSRNCSSCYARANGIAGERLWESRSVETQKQGFHCAWKSRKKRGIPTFPQSRRRRPIKLNPDISCATKTGHFNLLTTAHSLIVRFFGNFG